MQRTDHRDQGAQECGLLGGRKLVDCFQQEVGPSSGGSRLAAAIRSEHNGHAAAVSCSRFLGDQALALQCGDAVGRGGSGDAELFCQNPQAEAGRIGP